MSAPTAQAIELQLTLFDLHVRQAIEAGNIQQYMTDNHGAIKAFYKSCRNVEGDAKAAFAKPRFVNKFLLDWRHNTDSPEFFLRRQQGKIREWDGVPQPPLTMPPTPQKHRRTYLPPAQPGGEAGPVTAATRAARDRTVHFEAPADTAPRRLFSTLNQDTDSDVEMNKDFESDEEIIGKGKMKATAMKQEKVRRDFKVPAGEKVVVRHEHKAPAGEKVVVRHEHKMPAVVECSDEEIQEVPWPAVKKSKKPPAKATNVQTDDEGWETDKPPARKPKTRPQPIPTGQYHDPPCEQCNKLQRHCEKEQSGRACVSCKRNKHRCNYSMRNAARQVKSQPVVEDSDNNAAGSGAGPSSRRTRPAAKRPKQDEAAAAPKPPRRKKRTTPGLHLAADPDDERMSDMENRLRQAHNKIDGAIMGLQKASRLERCERKLDRLTLLIEAVCQHVGIAVAAFEEGEPAVNPTASTSAGPQDIQMSEPAVSQEQQPAVSQEQQPAASTVQELAVSQEQEQEPAASTVPEPAASQEEELAVFTQQDPSAPILLPALTLIPPTPHQSQDTEMRGPAGTPVPATFEPLPVAPETFEQPVPAAPDVDIPAAAEVTPAALDVPPVPKPRSRKKTPVLMGSDALQVPQRSTRSRSRSRSPSPLAEASGSKRKAEEGSADGESAAKKARA